MKQLNNNTFGKNSWRHYWEKLCFLRNTLRKIPRVATDKEEEEEEENTILAELMFLSHHLMALIIDIPDFEILPKEILFKNQMIKFQIYVDEVYYKQYFLGK